MPNCITSRIPNTLTCLNLFSGCVAAVMAFQLKYELALLFIVIRALLFSDPVAGWPSLVSIILFLGSLQLLCMGIMSMYISKIYLETKKRQIYIIREKK